MTDNSIKISAKESLSKKPLSLRKNLSERKLRESIRA